MFCGLLEMLGKKIGEGGCLVEPELSRRRALLERRQVWKFHHLYQPVDLHREKFTSGISRSLDLIRHPAGRGCRTSVRHASLCGQGIGLCGSGISLCGLGNSLWLKIGLCGSNSDFKVIKGLCGSNFRFKVNKASVAQTLVSRSTRPLGLKLWFQG